MKKKEREQLKLKKQQELEEKNKEKQKLEEQKLKTAAAFVNFFVPKKTDTNEEKRNEESSAFMPFEIKSDMRLAPLFRRTLDDDDKDYLDGKLNEQDADLKLYLDELKLGKKIGKSSKTWPFEETDSDDLIIMEENVGESIVEQKPKLERMRAKFLKFHENQRPPYFGTWKKRSRKILARRPFEKDEIFNYDVDSDEEWEEEGEGESLKGTDDEEEKDNESDHEYEEDEVFVPHGYLSDDETNDEIKAKLSPTAHKAKLKLLKNEFDEEMRSKTQKLKPRVIGCIWYNKDRSNVEEAIDKYLQPFSIICNGQIQIKKRSEFVLASTKKAPKQLDKEHIPVFLKLIHGSIDKRKKIVKEFIEQMSNNGIQLEVSQMSLSRLLKTLAQWQKCPEDGVMHNKLCWYVGEDVRKEYNVNLSMPNQVKAKNRKTK
ncbi:Chromatin assembly factor 1 subunit A [Popillia japonica]|uniref:Chromatin assembly factor 1 subunit A n=1 Tax=Popillia japonica TaxID=7064 RepID=A0AAW1IE83_POPJA